MLHSGNVGSGSRPLLFPVAAWAAATQGVATHDGDGHGKRAAASAASLASAAALGAPTHHITCLAISNGRDEDTTSNGASDKPVATKTAKTINVALSDFYTRAAEDERGAGAPESSSSSVTAAPLRPSRNPLEFGRGVYGRSMVTGALSGELVHWEQIEDAAATADTATTGSSSSNGAEPAPHAGGPVRPLWRPRALLFHSGASSCTALTSATLSTGARVFVAATSEGFMSCWSEGGARCRRSALVLPFAASVLIPLYSFAANPQRASVSAAGLSSSACLTSSVPSRFQPTQSYIVCANLTGASSTVYVVRLPKFAVVAMFEHSAPLISLEMSHAPYTAANAGNAGAVGVGSIGSADSGPFLAALTVTGVVSLWKLSEYVGAARRSVASSPSRPLYPSRAMSGSPGPGPSVSPPPQPRRHVSAGALSKDALDAHTTPASAYASLGAPTYDVAERMLLLPAATADNLMADDPVLSDSSPLALPSLHPTCCALSKRSRHLLVLAGSHFMLISTQHFHLELPIQSMEVHLKRARALEYQRASSEGQVYSGAIMEWSSSDTLVGCAFMADDVASVKRMVMWSAEGGIFVFLLSPAPTAEATHAHDSAAAATDAVPLDSRFSQPIAVNTLTQNSVVPGKPRLVARLFAMCHLQHAQRGVHDHSSADGDMHTHHPPMHGHHLSVDSISERRDQPHSRAPSRAGHDAFLAPPLFVPSTVRVDQQRIVCGNSEGEIYQFFIPRAPANSSASLSPLAPASIEYELDPASGVLHVHPTQVIGVSAAFRDVSCEDPAYPFGVAGADSDAHESAHSRFLASGGLRARKHSLPLLPSVHRARAPSRSVSLDQLSAVRNASAAANDGTHSPHSARTDSRPTTPSVSASALLSNSALGLHPDASNPCTSSCMLVDPVREQVVLARGFQNGQLQLLNLCGPVHGGLSSAFVVPAGGGPARFETQAHDAALTCMSFASKHSDSKNVSVLLITGSVDGDVHTWEMHSARLLHTFHCGSPVIALQQPLNIPTVAALVQAQKVGLLSPSNSDSVATSHVLRGDDPMSGPIAASLDMDVIYQTPSNDLLFIVCADHSIRSAMVQAQSNDVIMAQMQASNNGISDAARRAYCNQLLQVYRGHRSPVHSVLFNAFTAANDLLLSRDRAGVLYVFSCSSGALEQSVEGDSEVQAILQNYDLVSPGSQLSLMAYQLRQLASFAPGLFQLANEADADMKQEVASKGAAATSKLHVVAARIAQMQGAMKRLQAGVKRVGHRLTQSHSATTMPLPSASAVAPLVFGSSSLGSFGESGVDSSAQQHILCTYLLNRFLFHQQQSGYNASILSGVHHGMAAAGDSVVGNNGTAAIVYRPSLLQRGSGGKHVLQTLDLHSTATAANTQRLHSLHLSVYALDVQQLCVELCSRYAALTSSHSNRSGPPDSKRSAQSAWHSLVACLFDWTQGAGSVSDLLQRHMAFTPPSSQQAFAVFSDRAQGLSVLFPSHTHSLRRWSFDGECTALHLLSLSGVLHTLMASAESAYKPHLQRVLTYYHQQLPRQLPSYQEGDVHYLALYSLHTHESIHLSARTLLQGVIERASEERRSAWWREWSVPYSASIYTSSSDALLRRNLFSLSLLRREEVSGAMAMTASSPSGAASPVSSPPGTARSASVLARSPTGLGATASASPPPVSSSGRRGSTLLASSPSSSQLSSVASLPEYVSDREMMSAFVLCSIFFFEYNAQFASVRQQQFMHTDPTAAASLPTLAFGGSAASFSECAAKVPFLVHTLLRMLAWQSHMHENNVAPCELVKMALACDLLSRGFSCFRAYIPVDSLPLLIRRLQYISLHSMMIEKACNNHAAAVAGAISLSAAAASAAASLSPSSPVLALHAELYKCSRRLLLAVGSYHSSLFVFILGKEILLKHVHTLMSVERGHYLLNILSLLRNHARAASPALLDAVHTLLKLLHPSHPGLRSALFNSCVDILRELCVLYPQCSFDMEHGRFAIGTTNITYHMVKGISSTAAKAPMQSGDTHDNHLLMGAAGQVYRPQRSGNPYAVLIFDLKTAGKWRILEGHKADVTAVCFHPNGSHLVSYCARDLSAPSLRVWKLGESGFMSDLLHSHGKCTKQWNLQPIDLTHQIMRDRLARIKDRYIAQQGKAQAAKRADEQAVAAAAAAGMEGAEADGHPHASPLPSVVSSSQLHAASAASAVPSASPAAASAASAALPAFASAAAAAAQSDPVAPPHTHDSAADAPAPSSSSSSSSSVSSSSPLSPLLLPLSSVVSCSELEDEEFDELTAVNDRLNKVVKLTWSADHVITLIREDGSRITMPHKI